MKSVAYALTPAEYKTYRETGQLPNRPPDLTDVAQLPDGSVPEHARRIAAENMSEADKDNVAQAAAALTQAIALTGGEPGKILALVVPLLTECLFAGYALGVHDVAVGNEKASTLAALIRTEQTGNVDQALGEFISQHAEKA